MLKRRFVTFCIDSYVNNKKEKDEGTRQKKMNAGFVCREFFVFCFFGLEGSKGRLLRPEYALKYCRKRTCIMADKEGRKCGDADPVGGSPPQWVSSSGHPHTFLFYPHLLW